MVIIMPENQNIEWKAKWKDDYLEWICGFANAQGGKIYIGCDDDGKVIGLPNIRKLLEDVPNKIRNAMSIVVDVNQLERDGKEYLEIVVPPYPVAINCKGVYYYRSGSTMQTLLAQNWRASFYANVVLRGIICPCRDLRWMILMMSWSRDSRPLPPRRAGSTKAF